MKPEAIVKLIKKRQEEVAKVRDKLRDDIYNLEALQEDCDRAYDCLQDAADALSELV